jgi:hypothetical protein
MILRGGLSAASTDVGTNTKPNIQTTLMLVSFDQNFFIPSSALLDHFYHGEIWMRSRDHIRGQLKSNEQ